MRPTTMALIAVLLHVASLMWAASDDQAVSRTAQPADARALGVGRLAPALAATTLDGKPWSLDALAGSKAMVLAMTNSACPVSRKYAPTLARLEAQWRDQGVTFVFINSSEGEDAGDIGKQIAEHRLAGPYVMDADHHLAVALGARTTAEVFVLDAARTIVYRGAIDDQYSLTAALDAPRRPYLIDALQATLAGQCPRVAATTVAGCALELPRSRAVEADTTAPPITWHNRISRIVQDNCMACHRAGGIAPFALETWQQVKSRAGMLEYVLHEGIMPPWFAAPAPAGEDSPWANDRALAAADKADLIAWLSSADKPEGDAKNAALPRTYPVEWSIGEPDSILQIPEPIDIKADGVMPYIHVRVDADFDDDKWVQAIEVLPTARQVVHHVLVSVVPRAEAGEGGRGRERIREAIDETRGFFAAYVPGNGAAIFPEGFAKLLPRNSTLIFQLHYTPNGHATMDQTRIGFRFAKDKPRHVVKVAGIAQHRINIPPNDPNHAEHASMNVPFDVHLLAFMPHMHVRGKAFQYQATRPDGTFRTLLEVPRYDFNWQLRYELREPLPLPAGSKIDVTAWYDNSAGNAANPDPNANVRWGPQTFDEMMLGYVEYYADAEEAGQTGLSPSAGDLAASDRFERLLRLFDANKDSVIARDEVPERIKRQFDALDRDKDGRVTREEMN